MNLKNLISATLCLLFVALSSLTYAQTVSGVVMDADLDEPLIGANVIIQGTSFGSSTDIDGRFEITSSIPFPWTLEISYTGYSTQTLTVEGPTSDLSIIMASDAILSEEIIVSASRRREKVQEAPASVSVLTARKLQASPQENPARSLINLPGVTIQQQSAGRINIQLRGDGGLFGSASFPILDYRSLTGPGLGTYDALNTAVNNVDLERIEVVRGPGSALYGPDVTSGVIHFISKSPIDRPGTTVELIGGELNTFGVSARHATRISEKFGFKVNAVYKKGDEFSLDPNDPDDAAQIAKFRTSISIPQVTGGIIDGTLPAREILSQSDLDPDGDGNVMQDFWEQGLVSATLEFRPTNDLSFNLAGGWNQASSVFYQSLGEGINQSSEIWTQLRMQKGGLFGQVFYLDNNGGTDKKPTALYQTGNVSSIKRQQFEAQLQYNWDFPNFLNSNWTAGADYRLSKADTENLVYGRSENDDDFSIFGVYVQGKLAISPKLDFVVAGRFDQFNFLDDESFQPRAVLVYKAAPTHTFRLSYNKAVGAPSQLINNIDFPVGAAASAALGGRFMDFWLKGNRDPQTFGNNPMIVFNEFFQSQGFPNLPVGTPGLPNAITYGAVSADVLSALIPGIEAQLTPAVGAAQAAAIAGAIQGYLVDPANAPGGVTGSFEGFNFFNGKPLGIIDAPVAKLRREYTWEFGYKGLIANKLGVSLDIYHRELDGNTLFTGISPVYALTGTNYGPDLQSAVAAGGVRDFIFNLLGGSGNSSAGPTADALGAAIAGAYGQGGATFGALLGPAVDALGILVATTPTEQMPNDGLVHSAAGYRTFDAYDYWGADLGLEYYISNDLSLFGNYSWLSDNVFQPTIQGTDGETETTSNSAPLNKFRLGFNYTPDYGFRGNMAFQHDDSYEVFLGQFSGDTEVRNLIDAGFGYKWENGISFDVTAQNLFNNEYRYFPNFPKIGRRVLGKLTFDFGGDDRDASVGDRDGDGVRDQKDACPDEPGLRKYDGCPQSPEEMSAATILQKADMAAHIKAKKEAQDRAEREAIARAEAKLKATNAEAQSKR